MATQTEGPGGGSVDVSIAGPSKWIGSVPELAKALGALCGALALGAMLAGWRDLPARVEANEALLDHRTGVLADLAQTDTIVIRELSEVGQSVQLLCRLVAQQGGTDPSFCEVRND